MAQQDFVIFLVGEIFEGGGRHGVVGFGFEAAELDFDLFHDSQPLVQVVRGGHSVVDLEGEMLIYFNVVFLD